MTPFRNFTSRRTGTTGHLIQRRLAHRIEILEAPLNCLHITEFRVDIKQIPKNGAWNPVANCFLHRNRPETFCQAVTNGLTHAGACRDARYQNRIDICRPEKTGEIRPVKCARSFLYDDLFAR